MHLESLPDLLDDATHNKLDKEVEDFVSVDLSDVDDLTANWQFFVLLTAIVESGRDMGENYVKVGQAKKLVQAYEELRIMLASAWRRKSYREIRNLAILREQKPDPQASKPILLMDNLQDLHENLSRSFEAKYRGAAVDGLYEYLTQSERLFKTVDNPKYYAKFCSIVQSSGTGKSRMLIELSKRNVIVIYMNLRGEQDKLGFPGRDPIPSKILTEFPATVGVYRVVCHSFFTALFDTLGEYLSTAHATRKSKENVMRWVGQMCDMRDPPRSTVRTDFFRKIFHRYTKVLADHVNTFKRQFSATVEGPSMSNRDNVDETADKLRELILSDTPSSDPPDFAARLTASYKNMATSLEKVFADNSDHPKLVIAVDEAHPLTPVARDSYRPADVFCRVVNEYSHHENHAVWVVFASTTSKVADFSPPNQKHNSDRIAVFGEKLFPPYTQLGWDQSALGLGKIDIEDIPRVDHIAGYGRPLWKSLESALTYPQRVLDTASSKLCAGHTFDASKTSHVLAVLGQRFGLNVTFGHPESVQHLEHGVASHLRICLATTIDRNWRFTTYPSEPLLSCAAARVLHEKPDKLGAALTTLLQVVNSGMIDMGQRGELASRLLWLLAKDLFVRTEAKNVATTTPSTWEDHLVDCEMIPVVDWLEFIFGPRIWDEENSQTSVARESFRNAYLNFSHWVCMTANIAGSKEGSELGLYEWTLRHWQRTSGIQCCHQQPRIDKVIPIYFKDGSENASAESQMSHIFISDKARESESSRHALSEITRRHESVSGNGASSLSDSESLPYIAILADLSQASSFFVTFPEREIDDRCLRIYAAGVDATTYPFLAKYPALVETLETLVRVQRMPRLETPIREYLNAQLRYGTTSGQDHMLWEHGKTTLDVQR